RLAPVVRQWHAVVDVDQISGYARLAERRAEGGEADVHVTGDRRWTVDPQHRLGPEPTRRLTRHARTIPHEVAAVLARCRALRVGHLVPVHPLCVVVEIVVVDARE